MLSLIHLAIQWMTITPNKSTNNIHIHPVSPLTFGDLSPDLVTNGCFCWREKGRKEGQYIHKLDEIK